AAVTALAFSPDGRTLYSAGYDKVVRVWRRAADGTFQPDPRATLRVPIGPGRAGVINVLAVSPDGAWLAVSGLGVYGGGAGFGQAGYVVPDDALTPEMRQERSLIYLFNTQTQAVALLRGHEEDVLALAFAPSQAGQPQFLVSAGRARSRQAGPSTGRVLVWDIGRAAALNDKGELVDRGAKRHEWLISDIGPVPGEPPPGVAVRVTPDGQPRVAIAWGDGKLRVREFGEPGLTESVDEPRNANGRPAEYTHTLAAIPGRLLTGGIAGAQGYIQVWDDAPGRVPRAAARVPLTPPADAAYTLPRAIELVSSGEGRGLDYAAAVLRSPAPQGPGQQYRLTLLDLNALRPGAETSLGVRTIPPVVAASPDGRLLAVTGDRNRDIRVYASRDLFGRLPEVTPLHSAGAVAAAVAFASKGGPADLGLVLRPTGGVPGPIAALAPTDLVLDVGKRTLTADPGRQGWRVASPAAAGWRVDWDRNAPDEFRWAGPSARGTARLKLQPTQVVTAYALIPPRPPLAEPVLAVATWDTTIGEPLLAMYRATTGQQIRQLSGHVQPVHSLAATPDGRLLASAADDQTVCVWSLTDLADVVGKHATVPGLTFRPGDRSAVVASVEAGPLAAGDVIRSVSFAGPDRKPKPVAGPLDLFAAVWDEKPGES
ncbi:MAG TPA: WD40 repeat domain-containing protein, partial [Gemmataceae bacterium]